VLPYPQNAHDFKLTMLTDDWHGGKAGKGKGKDAEAVMKGKKIRAESVGKLYLSLMEQECDLWVHELDMRPAAEKF
jgi:hypothetical protein